MKLICKKCNRKFIPIFQNHVYNGHESILNGGERIMNGDENILTGAEKEIFNYSCPYCGKKYARGLITTED